MSSYEKNSLIKKMRKRKGLKQAQLVSYCLNSVIKNETIISYIENKHKTPRTATFELAMELMNMSVDTFFSPYLDSNSIDVLVKRLYITNLLDDAKYDNLLQQEAM